MTFEHMKVASKESRDEGVPAAGNLLLNTLWYVGDEELIDEEDHPSLRYTLCITLWLAFDLLRYETSEQKDDGSFDITVYKEGEKATATFNKIGFQQMLDSSKISRDGGAVAAGEHLLETLWKEGDQSIKDDKNMRFTVCTALWNAFDVGYSEFEKEYKGAGGSMNGEAKTSTGSAPSSGTSTGSA